MKLPLVISIFFTSAYCSIWPYHEGISIPSGMVLAGSTHPVSSTVNVSPGPSVAHASTIVSGPTMGPTVIKGAVAGPVTITGARTNGAVIPTSIPVPVKQSTVIAGPSEGAIIIKGPTSGSITIVGPSDGPFSVSGPKGNVAVLETAKTTARADAEARIETTKAVPGTTSEATETSTSFNAVTESTVSPAIGPIKIPGAVGSVRASASGQIIVTGPSGSALAKGTAESSSTVINENPESPAVVCSPKINLIAPVAVVAAGISAPTITVAEPVLKSIATPAVPSAIVTGPSGSISNIGGVDFTARKHLYTVFGRR